MKLTSLLILLIPISMLGSAQKNITLAGETYLVNGEVIFQEGVDTTMMGQYAIKFGLDYYMELKDTLLTYSIVGYDSTGYISYYKYTVGVNALEMKNEIYAHQIPSWGIRINTKDMVYTVNRFHITIYGYKSERFQNFIELTVKDKQRAEDIANQILQFQKK